MYMYVCVYSVMQVVKWVVRTVVVKAINAALNKVIIPLGQTVLLSRSALLAHIAYVH
eukprot:SAG11_NODE_3660_length_2303_cov_1.401089_3_plen_57_part_00